LSRFTHNGDTHRSGVVWGLAFGGWVLLQPERINAYAPAVIQTMRADEDERGCLMEEWFDVMSLQRWREKVLGK
jgi:hypothetical protein